MISLRLGRLAGLKAAKPYPMKPFAVQFDGFQPHPPELFQARAQLQGCIPIAERPYLEHKLRLGPCSRRRRRQSWLGLRWAGLP